MNKVFAAFWYSGILPLLSCTTPTTTPTTTTTTTTFENHESLSRPQSAKKEGTKAKQNRDKKKSCFPPIRWLKTRGKHTEPIPQSSTENRDNVQDSGVFVTEEGECVSTVLTEEPQQEVLEMDRLEAELESELQKLPGCSTEASGFEGKISDICETGLYDEISQRTQLGHCTDCREFNTDTHVQDSGVFVTEEGECASSVPTEEPQPEVLEMDCLEAELEPELQKLPGCSTEASGFEGKISDICEFNTDTHVQDSGVCVTKEGECASSVPTEEPQPEVLEMDRLEAELESELQKLLWCSTEASGFEGKISDICEFNTDTHVQDSGVCVTKGECASSVPTEEPQPEVLEMDRLEAELESELQKLLWCSTEASGFEGKISDICEFNTDTHVQDSGVCVTKEGECASSVPTEEPQPEVLEMDRLEAELESELQKLLWCSTEASGFEGKISDICEFNTDTHVQDSGVCVTKEGECASSVPTEEPQPEVLEMDRLEAELESELQKLPWCSTELLDLEEKYQTFFNTDDASFEGFYKPDGQTYDSFQLSGVLPSELDQKLCHLLIEQQESQIVGLEFELHWAQSKLHEKEAELQALKDCVKRLTEFSLATASGSLEQIQLRGAVDGHCSTSCNLYL